MQQATSSTLREAPPASREWQISRLPKNLHSSLCDSLFFDYFSSKKKQILYLAGVEIPRFLSKFAKNPKDTTTSNIIHAMFCKKKNNDENLSPTFQRKNKYPTQGEVLSDIALMKSILTTKHVL